MNANRTLTSSARRRLTVQILAWFCLLAGCSFAIPVPPCPASCECSSDGDGLRKASCSDVRWNGVRWPDIRVLVLRPPNVDVGCSPPKNVSLLFPQLSSISLRNCSLSTLPVETFRHLKWLREVDLSYNSLARFGQSLFADNTELRYANLENNPLVLHSYPLLWSDSIWEVSLARCNLAGQLPAATLGGLPKLRYLSLADNGLKTIPQNSLPSNLKRLDLSGNSIVDVPLSELHRLKGLKDIDVSRNPVNCTCQLMGFQNWVSGEGAIFRNRIRCASPAQYAGYSLVDVPQRRLCDLDDQRLGSNEAQLENGRTSGERFSRVASDEDDFLFDVEIGRVVGEENGHRHSRRSAESPTNLLETGSDTTPEGSGAEEGDVPEGSGVPLADEDENTTMPSSKMKNESVLPPTTAANLTEFGGSSEPTSKVESISESSTPSAITDDSSGRPTRNFADNISESTNASKAISPDIIAVTSQNEPESTTLLGTDYVGSETTFSADVVSSDSTISGANRANFEDDKKGGTSDSTTNSTPSAETGSSKVVEDLTTQVTRSVGSVSQQVPNSTEKFDDLATTAGGAAVNETDSATPGPTTTVTEEPVGLGAATNFSEGRGEPAAPTNREVNGTAGGTEKKDNDGGKSTEKPMQGQMTKAGTSTPYIIPALLIVAVALVCLAIYFSQHSCRPKSWNGHDAKTNGPATELQDVSLLRAEARRRNSDLYSKKYEAEGQNPQTEKLTNGDSDHPAEENGALLTDQLLAPDHLPPVKKSTTRVTTNYESLPKTPIIIQKS